jgi:hypothetical protein
MQAATAFLAKVRTVTARRTAAAEKVQRWWRRLRRYLAQCLCSRLRRDGIFQHGIDCWCRSLEGTTCLLGIQRAINIAGWAHRGAYERPLGVAHWAHRTTPLPDGVTPSSLRAGHLRVTAPEVDDCLLNPGLIVVHWARRLYGFCPPHLPGACCRGCYILSRRETAACQLQKWWRTDRHWARHRRCLRSAIGPLIAACSRGGLTEGPWWARSLFQECLLQRGYRFCPRQVCGTCQTCTRGVPTGEAF